MTRAQFSLRWMFIFVTLASVIAGATTNQWFSQMLLVIGLINLLGFGAGFIITSWFNFPRDGGYRDPEIRQEMAEPGSAKGEEMGQATFPE